jgi:hypothetical protein
MQIPLTLDPDVRLLTDDELTLALSGLEERGEAWRAIQQLLSTHFAHAVGRVSAPQMSEREAGHAAGQIDALLTFRADLKQRRTAQRKTSGPRRT